MRVALALDRVAPKALGKDYFSGSMARTLAQRGFPDYLKSFAAAGVDPTTGRTQPAAPAATAALMRRAR